MSRTEEITICYLGEKVRRELWMVGHARLVNPSSGDVRGTFDIKGEAADDELEEFCEYRLFGRWESHAKYGDSFAFKTFVRSTPHGRSGVMRYLQTANGIGAAISEKLWEKFKGDAIRILRENPDVASSAVPQLRLDVAQAAAIQLQELAHMENCTVSLIDLLDGRGFPKGTAREAIRSWGNRAPEVIAANPYRLMAFRGCGFLRTDAMYCDLGHPPTKLKRQALCAWHGVASSREGHTWFPIEHAIGSINAKVSGAEINGPKAIELARRSKVLSVHENGDGLLWVAEEKKAQAESRVAMYIAKALQEAPSWPSQLHPEFDRLSDHQRSEVQNATSTQIGILAGSPGSGKTFSSAAIVRAICADHSTGEIAACAPTGKAAVRLTQQIQNAGIDLKAMTIHRLLGVESASDRDGWRFVHRPGNPLPYRWIFADETSMSDTSLMASLLSARARGTGVLFIGDPGQLAPVGHGAPLRDLMQFGKETSELGVGHLTEIHRNAGTIVRACADIRIGKRFTTDEQLAPTLGHNLKLLPASSPERAADEIVSAIRKIAALGRDPVWDVQVVIAVNKNSPLSRNELNKRLQSELNPRGFGVAGSPFRVGDKIICTKNGWQRAVEPDPLDREQVDGKYLICNGEQGVVIGVAPKLTTASFDGKKIAIPRGEAKEEGGDDDSGTGCDFTLAYAVSCHRCQGSEWPIVIVALDESGGAKQVCSREWLYTAISRAREVCLLVGKRSVADSMCGKLALHNRKTFLVDSLKQEIASLELEQECIA